jgi:hypothetical protein
MQNQSCAKAMIFSLKPTLRSLAGASAQGAGTHAHDAQ